MLAGVCGGSPSHDAGALLAEHLKLLNSFVEAHGLRKCELRYFKIAADDLVLLGLTDSSLNNLSLKSGSSATQFGGQIAFGSFSEMKEDGVIGLNLIDLWSRRQKRVVRSTFSGELYGLSELQDRLVYLLELCRPFLDCRQVWALCDAASVVECLGAPNPNCTEKVPWSKLPWWRGCVSGMAYRSGIWRANTTPRMCTRSSNRTGSGRIVLTFPKRPSTRVRGFSGVSGGRERV